MNAAAVIVVCAFLAIPSCSSLALADPAKKPSLAKPAAGKNPPVSNAVSASKASKSPNSKAATVPVRNGTARTPQALVTRKKVNGRWVRVAPVHSKPVPSYQTHPDPDRYRQIQQALANSGYFKGMVDGNWGDDSVAALKQFQTDRNIPNDGKISSLSLIGLGLGPHRETASAPATPPAAPPAVQPAPGAP